MIKKLILFSNLAVLFLSPMLVMAQEQLVEPGTPGPVDPRFTGAIDTYIWTLLLDVFRVFWVLLIGLAILMALMGAIKIVTSKGDPGKVREARDTFIWAAIGVAAGVVAFSIHTITANWLGV